MFLTRYTDVLTSYYSLYNTCMKLFYIAAAGGIVYVLRHKEPWRSTYAINTAPHDTFLHVKFAIAPCAVLALVFNEGSLFSGVSARGRIHVISSAPHPLADCAR